RIASFRRLSAFEGLSGQQIPTSRLVAGDPLAALAEALRQQSHGDGNARELWRTVAGSNPALAFSF
ncbi:MAG: hypothetical protein ABI401_15530, partial [Candidatus Dormibacter sp.]